MVDRVVDLAVVHLVNHRTPLWPPLALNQVLRVTKGRHVFRIEFDLTKITETTFALLNCSPSNSV